jgi:two-component system NtrC family sensor kinase
MTVLVSGILAASLAACGSLFFVYRKEKGRAGYLERALDAKNQRHDTTITEKITLSKKQLETAFDAITDLICALDSDLRITRVNKSYAAFVGVPIPKLLGRHCWEAFWSRAEPCDHCPAQMTFATGKPVLKHQIKMPDKDRPRYFTVATYPVLDAAGKPQNVIEHIRDSTDEKVILEQLIRSEKLASIGTMTAGIAHEMINPLSGISGTAGNMLQMPGKYGLNEKGVARVTAILDASSRASAIVKDLLHLSRKEDGTSMLMDVNSLVLKAVEAVRLKGLPSVEHKINLDTALTRVLCDPTKIQQVIINLVTNAVQSVLEKKSNLAREHRSFSGLILISTQTEDDKVRVDISDNGTGVADDIKGKIFDPFFTTRPPGEGTGLGLSICQKIVDEHQGRIFFESTESLTTFSLLLPAYRPRPESAQEFA